jgi:hypothetical protein
LEEETGIDASELRHQLRPVDRGAGEQHLSAFAIHLPEDLADEKLKAGGDAARAKWVPLEKAKEMGLAFDHNQILAAAAADLPGEESAGGPTALSLSQSALSAEYEALSRVEEIGRQVLGWQPLQLSVAEGARLGLKFHNLTQKPFSLEALPARLAAAAEEELRCLQINDRSRTPRQRFRRLAELLALSHCTRRAISERMGERLGERARQAPRSRRERLPLLHCELGD